VLVARSSGTERRSCSAGSEAEAEAEAVPRRLRRSSGSVSVPGPPQAIAAGVTQTGAGALILAGLATPLAASAITATMLTAIDRVHLKKGPWITNGGYEYNVVLIAAGLLLAEISPEPISFDAPLGDRLDGTRGGR
jgi:uncharacterized membrane protein YphA (DoxX/SURF4 family)